MITSGSGGDEWNVRSYKGMMNVTIVDARDNPASGVLVDLTNLKGVEAAGVTQSNVVSSFILFHVPGNHTDALQKSTFPNFVSGIRNSVADALEVCRASVGIVDMRAINIDVKNRYYDEAYYEDQNGDTEADNLLESASKLVRKIGNDDTTATHLNVTQFKATYEVRIFKEMHTKETDVSHRINRLQLYSKWADMSRLLSRSLYQIDEHAFDGVILDDIGYASRHRLTRPPLGSEEMADCIEEVALHQTRQIHQFVVAMSLIIVALITCAGSTVFTIKHASSVPSRMNPLVSDD